MDIVANGLPLNNDPSAAIDNPLVSIPSKISIVRAYVYSCTAGEDNTNRFNDDQFLAGCNRFAIENPVPSISTRCGLYGNTRDIIILLQEAEKKWGKPLKVDSKLYTSVNMGLPERKDFKKAYNNAYGQKREEEREEDIEEKRKPTVDVNETLVAQIAASTKIEVGLKNLKMQFAKGNQVESLAPKREISRVMAGTLKYKIQNIRKQAEDDQANEKQHDEEFEKEKGQILGKEAPKAEDGKVGLDKRVNLTQVQTGLTKKQVIVPSFETTTRVFQEHFLILREVKHKIDLLKQAYYG